MSKQLSIRINSDDEERLDHLVVAVRAFYEQAGREVPVVAQLARETTRSSALRDLLLAWDRGDDVAAMFSRSLTAPTHTEE